MLNYAIALSVIGTVARQLIEAEDRDKTWQRKKTLDSLVALRMQKQRVMPSHLLFASDDGERPTFSSLFQQASLLNGLSDLFNALVKVPIDHACFVQIVDQPPGLEDSARMALEKSLLRVSPFPLDAFEELLEVQEQVYDTKIFSGVLLDRHGRLMTRDEQSYFQQRKSKERPSLFIEAVIEEVKPGPDAKNLQGTDYRVQDFRQGLSGISELFHHWDSWNSRPKRTIQQHERIYIYSHLKGLLPACWGELQKRGVAAETIRLPQWIAYSNAIASYMEFLIADVSSAAFIFIGINGNCHFAEWKR
ncbi:MAG: hypothetical protein V4655_00340 [Bdellovibrionota bacterium]|nr:MAG: hypothetical protein EOP10_30690 [Pseudomonadota bacterium]